MSRTLICIGWTAHQAKARSWDITLNPRREVSSKLKANFELHSRLSYLSDDTKWQVVAKSNSGPIQDFTVSFQTLLPSTVYTFRVSSYNRFGISFPVYSDEHILTPSKLYLEYGYLQQTPFYRQPWFSMSVACVGTIIIIFITAVLCVKSKSYKYKRKFRLSYWVINCLSTFVANRRSTKDFRGINGHVNRRASRACIGALSFKTRPVKHNSVESNGNDWTKQERHDEQEIIELVSSDGKVAAKAFSRYST